MNRPLFRSIAHRSSLLATALLALVGCGEGDAGGGGGFSRPPTPVEVATIEAHDVADRFRAVGTVEAVESIVIVAEINGIIRSLPFVEGDRVERGALLVQLDQSELRASLDRAEAVLTQNRNAHERIKRVVEQKAGSAQDLDDAAAALQVAEADAALARARLSKTRVMAPFSGVVGPRLVSPGAYLRAGDPIAELTKLDQIEVAFAAPERFVPKLRKGAEVTVTTMAYPDLELVGKIHVVNPVLNRETRSVEILARVDNTGDQLRPGMSADVSAVLDIRRGTLTVPSAAVFAEGDQTLVYVVGADSTVARTPIVLGTRFPSEVEVRSGLEPGAKVVKAGHQKLYPGAKVMPVGGDPSGQPQAER